MTKQERDTLHDGICKALTNFEHQEDSGLTYKEVIFDMYLALIQADYILMNEVEIK